MRYATAEISCSLLSARLKPHGTTNVYPHPCTPLLQQQCRHYHHCCTVWYLCIQTAVPMVPLMHTSSLLSTALLAASPPRSSLSVVTFSSESDQVGGGSVYGEAPSAATLPLRRTPSSPPLSCCWRLPLAVLGAAVVPSCRLLGAPKTKQHSWRTAEAIPVATNLALAMHSMRWGQTRGIMIGAL